MDATREGSTARATWGVVVVLLVCPALAVIAFVSSIDTRYYVRDRALLGGGVTLQIRCAPPSAPGRAPMELDDADRTHPLNTLTGVNGGEQADIAEHCRSKTSGRRTLAVILLLVTVAGWALAIRRRPRTRRPRPAKSAARV